MMTRVVERSRHTREKLARLARCLRVEQPEAVRVEAIEAIGKLLDDPWASETGSRSGTESHPYRRRVAPSIMDGGEPRDDVVTGLIANLVQDGSMIRRAAAGLLGRIGDARAVTALHGVLADGEGATRRAAALALADLGEPGWEQVVLGDADDLLRLGRSDDPRAVDVLRRCLAQGDRVTRVRSLDALGQVGVVASLIPSLVDPDPVVRAAAARALRSAHSRSRGAGGEVVRALAEAARSEAKEVRAAVARVMGQLGDPTLFDSLVCALEDERWEVRAAAAEALGNLADPRAREPLSAARVDPRSEVWVRARDALRALRVEPCTGPLVDALRHADWDVRLAAIDALADHPAEEAFEALGQALHDGHPGVSRHALARLLERADSRTLEVLTAQMKVGGPVLRQGAAQALARLGTAAALEALIEGMKGGTRAEVSFVLAEPLGLPEERWVANRLVTALADEDSRVRMFAFQSLEEMSSAAPDVLVAALGSGIRNQRDAAFELLGRRAHDDVAVRLVPLLGSSNEAARSKAAQLFEGMGQEAMPTLVAALDGPDPEIAVQAAHVLGKLGGWRAVKALERARHHRSSAVRDASREVLAAMRAR